MISDDDTWDYSVALMDMAAKKGYKTIKLVRAMELLGMTNKGEVLTKDRYMELVGECRKLLAKQFTNPDKAVREMIENDPDTLLTYRGFIRFLEADLK
jgi:pyoverdine/dityrosine biosynthesis protein Dit1